MPIGLASDDVLLVFTPRRASQMTADTQHRLDTQHLIFGNF